MENIIDFPDPFRYLQCGIEEKINGVSWMPSEKENLDFFSDGTVSIGGKGSIKLTKDGLAELMVMWLALNKPELLKLD